MQAECLHIAQLLNSLTRSQQRAVRIVVETLIASGATVDHVVEILEKTTFLNDLVEDNASEESNASEDGECLDAQSSCGSIETNSDGDSSGLTEVSDSEASGSGMDISEDEQPE
ncbi:hypothetical protein VNI00_016637 [Paramarasmius palmivorus]|uniref:Uncharacterized protein n=1 Tax=Paramarasmius palmivorus TaxID=297713 RepID=A0AAW0BBQ1_9AGAR